MIVNVYDVNSSDTNKQSRIVMAQDDGGRVVFNLEAVTVYFYPEQLLLEPDRKLTNISNNLLVQRKTGDLLEKKAGEEISNGYFKKEKYSLFLGSLQILSQTFLVFAKQCRQVAAIDKMEIFEIRETVLLGSDEGQTKGQHVNRQVEDYRCYLKDYLLGEGFYFSYDYDLSLSRQAFAEGYPSRDKYHWNFHMGRKLLLLQDKAWFCGVIQGSVIHFKDFLEGRKIDYYLITRRSWKRGGTRYNARGLDTKGYCANFCQTEQLVIVQDKCFSHLQIRGSVPAFWKQSGIYADVQFYSNHDDTKAAFERHFQKLEKHYAYVFCINLLSKSKSGENAITTYYEQLVKETNLPCLKYEFYDFHFACKGQKFQRSDYLIGKISKINKCFGYYLSTGEQEKTMLCWQKGVTRVNCLDCLDRTNLIQSKIAFDVLDSMLARCGVNFRRVFHCQSLLKAASAQDNVSQFVVRLKHAWADNGDMISRHYTGTGSTHTNVTRTGKRDLKGIMDHGLKTLGRFYKQYMQDNYKQEVIDLMIGKHTETINLTEFEARLKHMKEDEAQSTGFVEI